MKSQEFKYLLLLQALKATRAATHSELSAASDMPAGLVNRYLRRLAGWGAVHVSAGRRGKYALAPRGEELLAQGAWGFLSSVAGLLRECHGRAVSELRTAVRERKWRKAVLYGATPLAELIGGWASEAGLEVVAVCDEERTGDGIESLDDLDGRQYDCVILSDWERAEDGVLLRLLSQYAEVLNLFVVDGKSAPEWG